MLRRGWLLACVAVLACAPEPRTGGASAGLVRLNLFPVAPEPRPRDVVVTGAIAWPGDVAQLAVSGARVLLQEKAAPPRLLLGMEPGAQAYPQEVSIRLKGRWDPRTFNKLVLPVVAPKGAWVRCIFYRKGLGIIGSENRARIAPTPAQSAPTSVVLDVPATVRVPSMFDEIELLFDGMLGPVQLGQIELCQQPIWAWLPAAEDGFGMVALGSDARSGVGLSTQRRLEADLEVPVGGLLRFSAAVPDALRYPGLEPVLRVAVGPAEDEPVIHKIPLDATVGEQARWKSVKLPLAEFEGRDVRIRFSLHTPGSTREAVCVMTRPRVETEREQARSVLLVTSDTHRADSIGAAGLGVDVSTPAIDALAQRGVLFEQCWSASNVTIPSHVSIMTATSPRDTGVLDNYTRLSGEARTIAESFRDAGFLTFAVVSAPHLSDAGSGLGQGFDRISAPSDIGKRRSALSIGQLFDWLEDAEGQDLFVWLHVFDAHTPYEPPAEFEARYWPAGRDAFDPALPDLRIAKGIHGDMPEGLRDPGLQVARYRGEVSYLDSQLARVLAVPRFAQGVIALTADHGECLGEHEIYWDHAGLYTQSIHVPLILAWPDAKAGQRISDPVSQLDLAQTVLQLAGVDDPSIPGNNLLAAQPLPGEARFAISANADRASVTKDQWHLIVSLTNHLVARDGEGVLEPAHRVELFDLASDRVCAHDLSRIEIARARDLRRLLCAWIAAAQPLGWGTRENSDPEMATHLAQLGYASQALAPQIEPLDLLCDCAECEPFVAKD